MNNYSTALEGDLDEKTIIYLHFATIYRYTDRRLISVKCVKKQKMYHSSILSQKSKVKNMVISL